MEFYGKNLGLTFQIADDTLDYNSDINLFEHTNFETISNYFKYNEGSNTFYLEEDSKIYVNQLINFPHHKNVKLNAGSTIFFGEILSVDNLCSAIYLSLLILG